MKKVFFALMMVVFAACNNTTETSVSDSTMCDTSCIDSTVSPVVDTLGVVK